MGFRSAGLACVVAATMSASASAEMSFTVLGGPELGGSWFQTFRILAPDFNFKGLGIVVTDTSGRELQAEFRDDEFHPALGFSEAGDWALERFYASDDDPSLGYAVNAGGIFVDELTFRSHFRDDPADHKFSLSIFAYQELFVPSPLGQAVASWDGMAWSFNTAHGVTWETFQDLVLTNTPPVPVPGAALLALLGLGAPVLVRRRK